MAVHKRTYNSGKTVWYFQFDLPGSHRLNRREAKESGFATKQAAVEAEAKRRIEEQKKFDLARRGSGVAAAMPSTLATLLEEFFRQHAAGKLAQKTVERYHELARYLDPTLTAMPLTEITPLHLDREWKRLLQSGGRTRKLKTSRPLGAKTVRNIAGVVSSAFSRGIRWGLINRNPVSESEPPVPRKHRGLALTTAQQDTLIQSAGGPWCLKMFLETNAALGARRGEVLALRWSDIVDGRATIARSLSQTKQGLEFKSTKSENTRVVSLPASLLASLKAHRQQQNAFRRHLGEDYRSDLDLIFANPDGTPIKPDSLSSAVSALCRRLKLPKGASLHTLRHTHGSHLLAAGVPLAVVSERLGHSSIRVTTDVYLHAIRGQDDDAVKKWEDFQIQSRQPVSGAQCEDSSAE